MSRAERILAGVIVLAGLLVLAALGVRWYGAGQHQAGYDAAVADGKAQYDRDVAAARKTESDLRAQLRTQDADALKKKAEYEANLEAAQRRVRAGTDRLLCPGQIPAAAAPGGRPVAGGPGADGEGPSIVPEVAAEILGDGADIAGLVRRYDRVVQRFEACRTLNAGP
jgi:hypothetical protein